MRVSGPFLFGGLWEGKAPGRESKINLLRLTKLFLAVPGRGTGRRVPGGWVEAGEAPGVPGRGKAGGW